MNPLPTHADWLAEIPFPLAVTRWPWDMGTLERIVAAWPGDDDPGWTSHRAGKRSYGPDGAAAPTVVQPFVERLHSPEFVAELSRMTGIADLRPDPRLQGGGLHEIAPGGRLGMHVDFNMLDGLVRRLNVLVYLNHDVPDITGDLRLESDDGLSVRRVSPQMGTMVVFGTTEASWHGHPLPLEWDHSRRSFAAYYYSPPKPGENLRQRSTVYRGEDKHKGGIGEVRAKEAT